jgi:hypothetical protein
MDSPRTRGEMTCPGSSGERTEYVVAVGEGSGGSGCDSRIAVRGVSGRRGKEIVMSWSSTDPWLDRPLSFTPSSVTEVSLEADPVRLCPIEFPRGRVASRNLLVCEGSDTDTAESGGGGGDTTGGGGAGGKTEAARGRPVTDGVYCVRFSGRVDVRLRAELI